MAVYRYPPEVHEFVKAHCREFRDDELARRCNEACGTQFTEKKMKAFRCNHGYKSGMGNPKGEEYWARQGDFRRACMYEFIRDNSWHVSSADMAKMLNKKFGMNVSARWVRSFRAKYKISSGGTGWQLVGHTPKNKGKKGVNYRSEEARKNAESHQFKKGCVPPRTRPVGSERIAKGRFRAVKVDDKRWRYLHSIVWEQHNGPLPEGYAVTFKDGNAANCDIDNLIMVRKAELSYAARKGYLKSDPELIVTGLMLARLVLEANKRRRERKNGESGKKVIRKVSGGRKSEAETEG